MEVAVIETAREQRSRKFAAGLERVARWLEENPNVPELLHVSYDSEFGVRMQLGFGNCISAFKHFSGRAAFVVHKGNDHEYTLVDSEWQIKFCWDVWSAAEQPQPEVDIVTL